MKKKKLPCHGDRREPPKIRRLPRDIGPIVIYSGVTYVHAARSELTVLSNERYTCSDVCAIKYIRVRAYGTHVCASLPSCETRERASASTSRPAGRPARWKL